MSIAIMQFLSAAERPLRERRMPAIPAFSRATAASRSLGVVDHLHALLVLKVQGACGWARGRRLRLNRWATSLT